MQPPDVEIVACAVGKKAALFVAETRLYVSGTFYKFANHKHIKQQGNLAIPNSAVLRIGLTKTYSRRMLLLPMLFGCMTLIIKAIPSLEISIPIIKDIWSIGYTFWSVPYQDFLSNLCMLAFIATLPLYWLSYRNSLEVNTTQGRYLLYKDGMDSTDILEVIQAVTQQKNK